MVEFLNDEKEDRETPLCSFLFYLRLFFFFFVAHRPASTRSISFSTLRTSVFQRIFRVFFFHVSSPFLSFSRSLAFSIVVKFLVYFFLAAGFTRNSPPSLSSPSLPFPIVSPVRAVGITLAYTLFHFLGRVRRCIRA